MNKVALIITVFVVAGCSKPKTEAQKEDTEKKETGLIRMEAEAQKHVGLQVAPAALTQLAEYLQVTGTVQPIDSRMSHVRPLARGRILDVTARVGDRVAANQVLARIDNIEAGELVTQLASAEAELKRIQVQRAALARQVERARKLSEIGASPVKEYEQSLAEEQALGESVRAQESTIAGITARLRRFGLTPGSASSGQFATQIRAPFSGVITKVQAAPGEIVESANELFTIVDLSRVWVQAEVYEKDLGRLRLGQPAIIRVDTYPDQPFRGVVTYISDILDPQTRTARVRCEVPNADVRLKLDMFATVELPTTFQRQAIAVPAPSVHQLEGKNVVFVRKDASSFESRPVQVGKTVNGQTEIISGLQNGEPIVIQGAFHLKSIVAGKAIGEE